MQRRFHKGKVSIKRRSDGGATIVGYAAVFYNSDNAGTEYELWPGVVERIAPGAFDRALREGQDVRGLFNHDANQLLGKTGAQTVRLSVDAVGLAYEIDLAETAVADTVAKSIERGDLDGSSFSFQPAEMGVAWYTTPDAEVRVLQDVDLFDVGPVTYPAYEATTTGLRSVEGLDEIRADHARWKAQAAPGEAEAVAVRARILDLENETPR